VIGRLRSFLAAMASLSFGDKLLRQERTANRKEIPPSIVELPLVHRYCIASGAPTGIFELSRVEVRKDPLTGTLIKLTYPALRVITGEIIGPRPDVPQDFDQA
jgi:hypothetical protein